MATCSVMMSCSIAKVQHFIVDSCIVSSRQSVVLVTVFIFMKHRLGLGTEEFHKNLKTVIHAYTVYIIYATDICIIQSWPQYILIKTSFGRSTSDLNSKVYSFQGSLSIQLAWHLG